MTKSDKTFHHIPGFCALQNFSGGVSQAEYDFSMKTIVALCLLIASAWAQNASSVRTESRARSLSVSFDGQDGIYYKFKVHNESSHAVSAFNLLLVPDGVPKVAGLYLCHDQCSPSSQIGDKANPVIKAGETTSGLRFEITNVVNGAIVVEAALFDDESFEGEAPAAGFLLASQIGGQAAHDRLEPAVSSIMSSSLDDISKANQIRSDAAELAGHLQPEMIKTFKLWFPDLADCDHRYARAIKAALVSDKRHVLDTLDQSISQGAPLAQWWDTTKQYFAEIGCDDCAEAMNHPRHSSDSPVTAKACRTKDSTASEGAATNPGDSDEDQEVVIFYVYELLVPEDDLGSEAAVASAPAPQSAPAPPPAYRNAPSPAPAPAYAATISPPPGPPASKPSQNGASSELGSHVSSNFSNVLNARSMYPPQPMAENSAYMQFFSFYTYDHQQPHLPGFTDAEEQIVRQVTKDWEQAMLRGQAKAEAAFASRPRYRNGEVFWLPPDPLDGQMRMEGQQNVHSHIQMLRTMLGETSFQKFDDFVYVWQHAVRGRVVRQPLPNGSVIRYERFFHYIANLSQLAGKSDNYEVNWKKRRNQEQRASDLSVKQWAALEQLANRYEDDVQNLNAKVRAAVPNTMNAALTQSPFPAPEPAHLSPGAFVYPTGASAQPQAYAAPSVQAGAGTSSISSPPGGHAMQTSSNVSSTPAPPMSAGPGAAPLPPDLQKQFNQELTELGIKYISKLKVSLGKTSFATLDRHVVALYGPEVIEKVVPATSTARENTAGPAQ
jgi:hypothetical protein